MGLINLTVKDYAIVDELELEFKDGMTVFTGETGAGKSIMIDALGLVLGDRAQSGVIRKGAEKTTISATFDLTELPEAQALLDEQGIDADEGECLLRRQISSDGRSRGFINGVAVPSQTLKALSEFLIDIHGQQAHQSLLRRDVQRDMLDEFAGHDLLASAATDATEKWKDITQQLELLSGDPAEREDQKNLLRYQIEELDQLVVSQEEINNTLDEHKRLANMTRIAQACQSVEDLFMEQDSLGSAKLPQAITSLQEVSDFDPKISSLVAVLNEASLLLDEAETQFRHLTEHLDFDQNEFDLIEQQLGKLNDLARKHHTQIEALPEALESLQTQLTTLEDSEQQFQALQTQQQQAADQYNKAAEKLSKSRRSHATKLSTLITAEMQLLGMAGGAFEVRVSDKIDTQLSATGKDQIEFVVSTNPGQTLQALNKVASGGELSRISLAIQVITAQGKGVPTLVFDEVDVGIGGGVAEIVGKKMRELGNKRQVLCVTHLPQVASLGHHHLNVKKSNDANNTWTQIQPLGPQERVEEIARMLGGLKITDQTLAHAEEMLSLS